MYDIYIYICIGIYIFVCIIRCKIGEFLKVKLCYTKENF